MKLFNILPNINLINENGEKSDFHNLIDNKTVILNMFYSSCKIKCQPLGRLLKRVNLLLNKHILEDDIHFISITLDSKNDTIEDLNLFKDLVWDKKCLNWYFYTGNYEEIENLRFKLGMYNPEPEIDAIKSNHSGSFMIFNAKTGFIKHTEAFDNPIDIARKVVQIIPKNFYQHHYHLDKLCFDYLTDDEIFENVHTMNSVFTVSFLPDYIKEKYDIYAEKQRGFQYKIPVEKEKGQSCCCKK